MKRPLVSIIIPFYKNNQLLMNAINSAINQKFKNFEIIIINDNNIEKNIKFLKKIKKKFKKIH